MKLDKANINDTISFTYGDRRYEVFIREIVPVSMDPISVKKPNDEWEMRIPSLHVRCP